MIAMSNQVNFFNMMNIIVSNLLCLCTNIEITLYTYFHYFFKTNQRKFKQLKEVRDTLNLTLVFGLFFYRIRRFARLNIVLNLFQWLLLINR